MTIKINFCDFWEGYDCKKSILYRILDKYFDVELSETPDFLFFSDFSIEHLKYDCVKIHYTSENVRSMKKLADFEIGFDYSDSPKYLRLPLYVTYFDEFYTLDKLLRKKTSTEIDDIVKRKTKFCCFIVSNDKSTKRNDFFEKLCKYKRVDSGGRVLNNIGRSVDNKLEFLRPYKFTIAFENSSFPGYTTEKVLQPFHVDTIPIYWGSPVVHEEFNTASFLNWHDYGSDDALIEQIICVDNDESLYRNHLKECLFYDHRENLYFSESKLVNYFSRVFRETKTRVTEKHRKQAMLLDRFYLAKMKVDQKIRHIIK